jgi:hypothetical protein
LSIKSHCPETARARAEEKDCLDLTSGRDFEADDSSSEDDESSPEGDGAGYEDEGSDRNYEGGEITMQRYPEMHQVPAHTISESMKRRAKRQLRHTIRISKSNMPWPNTPGSPQKPP